MQDLTTNASTDPDDKWQFRSHYQQLQQLFFVAYHSLKGGSGQIYPAGNNTLKSAGDGRQTSGSLDHYFIYIFDMILQSATTKSETIKVGAICPWYISGIQWSPVPQIAMRCHHIHDEERFLWRPSRRTAHEWICFLKLLAVDRIGKPWKTDAVFGWLLYVTLQHGSCFWQDRHEMTWTKFRPNSAQISWGRHYFC